MGFVRDVDLMPDLTPSPGAIPCAVAPELFRGIAAALIALAELSLA
jgi:hypothetical protein